MLKFEFPADEIIEETKNSNVVVYQLDLTIFKSIRAFAKIIIETEPRIDILIHNAGVAFNFTKTVSEEGLEMTMASNHYGMFLLTNLLIDHLKKMSSCRIVVVASKNHRLSYMDPAKDADLNPVGVLPVFTYGNSKFANVLFTIELAKRLRAMGITNITVNCLHPGVVRTEIFRDIPFPFNLLWNIITILFMKTLQQGIQTILYCALSTELDSVSGKYFRDCKEATPYIKVYNAIWQEKLWERSLEIVKLTKDDPKI